MGQDANNPSAAVAWPTGKSTATVYSGNQTFANLTSPLYTFAVSKQSAYDRDWKFGP
jgi:hypothetical protein